MCWKGMSKLDFFKQYFTHALRTEVQALEAVAAALIKRTLKRFGVLSNLTPGHYMEKCATILLNSASIYSFSGFGRS